VSIDESVTLAAQTVADTYGREPAPQLRQSVQLGAALAIRGSSSASVSGHPRAC
jgi:hypothetical protein